MLYFRNNLHVSAVLALLVFFCAGPTSFGQNSRGTILGHIQDSSGAAAPGAKVTLTNVGTNVTNEFTTNASGDYAFVDMVPGTYTLLVEKQGFKSTGSAGLILEVDQTLRQDFTLQVGAVTEVVQVEAAATMVQTDNTSLGNVMSNELIQNLPVNGRDFNALLGLDAGATYVGGGSQLYWNLHGLGGGEFKEVSLDGARPDSVSYLVDGVTNNGNFFSVAANIPSMSAIQEFKVQDGLYSAEYGTGSGQVNVAIKSGTNQVHGSGYDFIQNDLFQPSNPAQAYENAVNGTNVPLKSPFKQNQFGGTLGGPLVVPKLYNGRNKTFWFFAYEGGRRSTTSGTASGAIMVPTAQEKQGNFSDWPVPIYDPSTTGSLPATAADPTGRTQFPGNMIPSGDFNSIAQKILAYYPNPTINCTLPCLNYVIPIHNSIATDTETMRVDENVTSHDTVYFTGIIRNDDEPNPSMLPATGSVAFARSRLFGLTWQHSFGTAIINEARFGYNRLFFHTGVDTAFGPNLAAQLGLQNSPDNPSFFDIPVIGVNDQYSGIGSGNNGYTQRENDYQFVENLKLIRGRHTFTFGTDIRRVQMLGADGFTAMGQLNFTGDYTSAAPNSATMSNPNILPSGNPFADLLLGDPRSISAPPPEGSDLMNLRGTVWNFFAQDDFHITPRITLNIGLRYELPLAYYSVNNSGFAFNPADGGSLIWASRSFVNATTQAITSSGGTVNTNWLGCCAANTLVPQDKHDFAPRIGIAWRPFTTDRLVVRAGYGIFYDVYERFYDATQFDDDGLYTLAANPNYPATTGGEAVSPLALSGLWLPPVTSASLFSTATPAYNVGFQLNRPTNHQPYTQQWTLDTQYALTPTMLLEVGYVGSHAIHEPTQLLYNVGYLPAVAGDPCNYLIDASQATGSNASCATDPNFSPVDTRTPFKNFGPGTYYNANVLWSHYNALQTRLRQRFSNGLQYNLSYTYSRALDETSAINNIQGTNDFIMDPHNPALDYGPASFDQTHRFVATGSYEVPVGRGKRYSLGPGNWVLGNWVASGIYTLSSGIPYSVYAFPYFTPDQTGSAFGGRIRANVVSSPTSGFTQTATEWFNTSAFASPEPGTYGDEGKGLLRGPHFADLDMSFAKNFLFTERQRLQARIDIFNLGSNWHSELRNPDNTLTDSNFGSLVSSNGIPASLQLWTPRTIQLSLMYSF
jgi:Carboxypeptidase regulatory-like domain/TonB-dependent Receptor Plug Domain